MADEIILEKLEDGITRLVLNRPQKLNAINSAMRAAITQALDVIDASTETRVLILTAAPCRAFSVGGDTSRRGANARHGRCVCGRSFRASPRESVRIRRWLHW